LAVVQIDSNYPHSPKQPEFMPVSTLRFILHTSPAIAALAFACIAPPAQATEQQGSHPSPLLAQVTSVSQLSDVQPTDWAYQALESLVDRYGCIAGYPHGTYRGNRAITRYEFAAGLNACLDRILLLFNDGSDDVTSADLATLRRLQDEFEGELATLRGRVDALEARTAELETHQFSTTTKLVGEVIFNVSQAFGDNRALNRLQYDSGIQPTDVEEVTAFADRIRLNLDTSFTGRDNLRLRLQASTIENLNLVTGTNESRLPYDGNNGNDIILNQALYKTPIGDRFNLAVGTAGAGLVDVIDTTNPFMGNDGIATVSRFGPRNPMVHRGNEGTGIRLNYKLSDRASIDGFYLVPTDSAPNQLPKNGLFDGAYSAGAQLNLRPTDPIRLSLTYLHSYSPGGKVNLGSGTGTDFAQTPFFDTDGKSVATSGDHLGLQANVMLGDRASLGGWFGTIFSEAESGENAGDNATAINWSVNLAFPNFGGKGNLLGFVVGQPPHVTNSDFRVSNTAIEDRNSPWHLEAIYRIAVTDHISITPGAYYVINPEGDDRNDNILVGVLRTTFKF
jgi:Carbohydrate-selective porin, OprB family/S-layer homology domain